VHVYALECVQIDLVIVFEHRVVHRVDHIFCKLSKKRVREFI
jgi:hypothetical protein